MSNRSYFISINIPVPDDVDAGGSDYTSFRVEFIPGSPLPEIEKAYSEIGQWLAAMAHISEGTVATVTVPAEAPAEAPAEGVTDILQAEGAADILDAGMTDAPVAADEKKKKKKRRTPAQMEAARKAAANGVDPEPTTPEDPFGDDQKPPPIQDGHHGRPPSMPDLIAAARDWLGSGNSTADLRVLLSARGVEKLKDLPENQRAGVMAKFMETA